MPHASCQQMLAPLLEALTTPRAKPFIAGAQGPALAFTLSALMSTQRRDEDEAVVPVATPAPAREFPFRGLLPRTWLVLTPTQEEADELLRDMAFFFACFEIPADILTGFPERGPSPYAADAPAIDVVAQRMRTLFRLHAGHPAVVVTTPAAILQRLVPPTAFAHSCARLRVGDAMERESMIHRLLATGYRRVPVVDLPGEFSVRGGIMDIFSTADPAPTRIEYLGDTIDTLRRFDPATQESTDAVAAVDILPADAGGATGTDATGTATADADHAADAAHTDPLRHSRPPNENVGGRRSHSGIHPSVTALLPDYLTAPPFVVMDRPAEIERVAQAWEDAARDAREERHATAADTTPDPSVIPDISSRESIPVLPLPESYADWDELSRCLADSPSLAFDAIAPAGDAWTPVITLPMRSARSAGLGLRGVAFTETLATLERLRRDGPVMIVVRTAAQVGRLLELFADHHAPATGQNPLAPDAAAPAPSERAPFSILQGSLSSGFVAPSFPFAAVTEDEVFAKPARRHLRHDGKAATFLSSLDDVNAGDYVVHTHHGICRYRGLRRLTVQDCDSDYLVLEFAGRDKLYVPLDRLNQIHPYRAGEHPAPRLDALGGTHWAKTKARVAKHIEDMTDELVDLYANREVVTRQPYQGDPLLSHEFDAAFDYDETPDQLTAIDDIHRDLQRPRPMDRLLCGDVGYGKTEVAMRAAFHAVQTNRQVAVLTPTTLLAQQHYDTFARRFAPFPVRVAVLSRFQRPKDVTALLTDLAAGVIDILIGTHRLLQDRVRFHRLGLVIIDEEQWFGVRHKERLKQLRTHVDVLTLTATPIPRTLHMAFTGVRDLSVIDTPPPARLAIRTQVVRFHPTLVRDAIRRELARHGQVFYVHNRVETIERTGRWLREMVPDARIVMAHGQLNAHALEAVMLRFLRGDADVLLSTAIIQSGLDVPRANTILIDHAHTFGLAQLYQLRGRVGRAGEQAHAYFLFPDDAQLSADAQRRLTAIREFAELGSGFRIAAADLEIRGAGALLGKQQSGNIAAVGFDMYMRMVQDAAQRKRGAPVEEDIDPTLHLNVSAFLPDDYVENDHHRLSLYKRLSACRTTGDLEFLHEETRDRYGPPPPPAERLFEVMHLRLLAGKLRLESLDATNGAVTLTFPSTTPITPARRDYLTRYAEDRLRFLSPVSCEMTMPHESWPAVAAEAAVILNGLLDAGAGADTATATDAAPVAGAAPSPGVSSR